MYIIPDRQTRPTRPTPPDDKLTPEDVDLMDLLALHVICGTLREVRR